MFQCSRCRELKAETDYYYRTRKTKQYRYSKCKKCYRETLMRPNPKGTKREEDKMTIGDLIGKHRGSPMCLPWV